MVLDMVLNADETVSANVSLKLVLELHHWNDHLVVVSQPLCECVSV